MQIAFHRKLPVKPRTLSRVQQKIAFAQRDPRTPQRHARRDQPSRRAVSQEPAEQAFGVAAEPCDARDGEIVMQRGGRCIERAQPVDDVVELPQGREWSSEFAHRRLRTQQIGAQQQPGEIANCAVAQLVEQCGKNGVRACGIGWDGISAPNSRSDRVIAGDVFARRRLIRAHCFAAFDAAPPAARHVSRARHKSAHALALSGRLRSR